MQTFVYHAFLQYVGTHLFFVNDTMAEEGLRILVKNEIYELLENHDAFARQIANANLANLSFNVYEYWENRERIQLIFAERNQFDSIQEAFSAIFKKEMFDQEEWETSDDPDPTDEEWLTALKNIWINEYFPSADPYEQVFIEIINDDFVSSFKRILFKVNAPKIMISGVNQFSSIRVKKGHLYDYIFGQTHSQYFLLQWAICT